MTLFQKTICAVGVMFLLAGLSLAETPIFGDERSIRIVGSYDYRCGHWADGDNWTTEFIFMNMGPTQEKAKLHFFNSEGKRQEVQFQGGKGNTVSLRLRPYASLRVVTVGGPRPLTQGYAILDPDNRGDARIGTTAIFRRKLPDIPSYEASVPFSHRFHEKAYFPFDHRDGYLSGVALSNGSRSRAWGELRLDFYDGNGRMLASRVLELSSGQHTALSLTQRFPELVGKVGMMVVTVNDPPDDGVLVGFAIVGFRFNPDGPFTTITPMISSDEFLELR